ncbi:hypothetical protein F4801DRAFT_568092 [Xylaria longipes]|nr:hypothetical protein F4801DRAFT_568092 [Xylaria longipes]
MSPRARRDVLEVPRPPTKDFLYGYEGELIRSLAFPGMNDRRGCISDAHKDTFRLVLDPDTPDTPVNKQPRSYGGFAQWLASGNGIFWVAGKPGSGKSTFMKHISQDPRAFHLLASWSRPKPCVILSYFFWNSGHALQKSFEGLLRTLLFQILIDDPELAAIAFPSEINKKPDITNHEWGIGELFTAFKNVTEHDNFPFRVCIFVDGLDEYEGDHLSLVELLQRIASSPCTKLCVASRQWNVFQDALGRIAQTIVLHHFTRQDIFNYTQAMLQRCTSLVGLVITTPSTILDVVEEVTERSEGLFLWVTITVNSLLSGLENGDSLQDLRWRLDMLPPDLEQLYETTLNSIHPTYLERTAKMLKLAIQAEEALPLLLYWFADQYFTHDFTTQTEFDPFAHTPIELSRLINVMCRRVVSSCHDILEIRADPFDRNPVLLKVDFIHPTARAFLATPKMQEFLERRAPNFEAKKVIAHSYIQTVGSVYRGFWQGRRPPDTVSQMCSDAMMFLDIEDPAFRERILPHTTSTSHYNNYLRVARLKSANELTSNSAKDECWHRLLGEITKWPVVGSVNLEVIFETKGGVETPNDGQPDDMRAGSTHKTAKEMDPATKTIAPGLQQGSSDLETTQSDRRLSLAEIQVSGNRPEAEEQHQEQVLLPIMPEKYKDNGTKKSLESEIIDDWSDTTSSTNAGYAESLFSMAPSKTSAASDSSSDYIKPARDVLVEFLLEDIELFPLLANGATDPNIGVDRLARNFRRLLDSYSRELRQVAQNRIQRETAKFVQHNSAYVSDAVRMRLDTSTGHNISLLHVDVTETEQKAATKERLSKFLEELQEPDASDEDEDQVPPLPAEVASLLEDEEKLDTDYDEEEINNALIQVKNFLEKGSPFENLRKGLRTFVLPQKNNEQHPADYSSHVKDLGSPTPPEQYSGQLEVVTSTYINHTDIQVQGITMLFIIATLAFLQLPLSRIVLYVVKILCLYAGIKRLFGRSISSLLAGEGSVGFKMERTRHGDAADDSTLYGNASNIAADLQSFPILVDRIFDLLVPLQEPPIPAGKKRVRWTCQCGTRLFDDFVELKRGAIDNLEAELQQRASIDVFGALKQVGKLLDAAIRTWITLRFTGKKSQKSNPASTSLPLHNTNAQAASTFTPSGSNLHLLLCIEKGDFQTKLYQKIIDGYSNDKGVFRFLHDEYHNYRNFRTWFTLRGIGQLSLTRVSTSQFCFSQPYPPSWIITWNAEKSYSLRLTWGALRKSTITPTIAIYPAFASHRKKG